MTVLDNHHVNLWRSKSSLTDDLPVVNVRAVESLNYESVQGDFCVGVGQVVNDYAVSCVLVQQNSIWSDDQLVATDN